MSGSSAFRAESVRARPLRVVKAHGAGNDFAVIFDPDDEIDLSSKDVRIICHRRFGVGADGVIRLVRKGVDRASGEPIFFMDYRNADGSVAEMCGNGVRCAAHYLATRGIISGPRILIDTRAGRKEVESVGNSRYAVDMGQAQLDPAGIGVDTEDPRVEIIEGFSESSPMLLRLDLTAEGSTSASRPQVELYAVGMGNPHAVVVLEDDSSVDLHHAVESLGPLIERHPAFPNRTNVEFISPVNGSHLQARVWERGVGETLSCGTGACAAGVVAVAAGLADPEHVVLRFPGGELVVSWQDTVRLEGPAVEVFSADLDPSILDVDEISVDGPQTSGDRQKEC